MSGLVSHRLPAFLVIIIMSVFILILSNDIILILRYIDITSSTRFFALAAIYDFTIIGLIVAEIKPYIKLNKEVRSSI